MNKNQVIVEKKARKTGLIKRLYLFYTLLKKENLPRMIFYIAIIVLVGGTLVFFSEWISDSKAFDDFFDTLWWTVVTITGVGYGDRVPRVVIAKIFAVLLMFVGVIITSLLSGTIASIFIDKKLREGKGLKDVSVKNHILICGWNQNAENIIKNLINLNITSKDSIVLINEMDAEEFQTLQTKYPNLDLHFVRGEFTNETILKRAAVKYAKSALILLDTVGKSTLENIDEKTIIAVLALKSLNPGIVISAELSNANNEQHLRRANVDDIIINGEFNGFMLASSTISPGIPQFIKELLSFNGNNSIRQVQIPVSFVGKTFLELSDHFAKAKKGILIGILSEEKKMTLNDILSDDSSGIDEFIKRKFQEAEIDLLEDEKNEMKIKINPGNEYIVKDGDWAFLICNT